uniref:hypothetical protein n=1 Tax=Yoonia sp. TaxID=2212373 RepID=UPI00404859F0
MNKQLLPRKIEMMPAEEIAGVVFPAWDPTEFVRTFSELNWAEVVADLQPIVVVRARGAARPCLGKHRPDDAWECL